MIARQPLKALFAAVLFSALVGPSSPANAYVRTRLSSTVPVQWANQCIPMVVHNAKPPAPLTPGSVLKATSAAASSWGRPGFTCTMLNITTTATAETDAPVGNDGTNRVAFREDRWCRYPADAKGTCYDPSMVALTTMTALADGTIIDADIEVNAVDFKWADRTEAGSKGQDLQSALVHEFGHLIGLEHTCGVKSDVVVVDHAGRPVPACSVATAEQRAAIMYPAAASTSPLRRVLSADDAKAVCQIYAIRNTAPACRADAGVRDGGADAGVGVEVEGDEPVGCTLARGRQEYSAGLLLLAFGLLALLRRTRVRASR
ncbi:MAG TPA: hypothetical protein VGG33_04865 [Polyangia bacterium]